MDNTTSASEQSHLYTNSKKQKINGLKRPNDLRRKSLLVQISTCEEQLRRDPGNDVIKQLIVALRRRLMCVEVQF